MAKKKTKSKKEIPVCSRGKGDICNGSGIYFVGFIGALVYYISTATGFWKGVFGVIKAMVWPAFLVYHTLLFLGAN